MRLYRLFLLTFPGLVVGFIAGVVAGGLAAFVGQPTGWALVSALTLAVPLGLLGGGYTMLLINEKVRLGGFAPAALYWLVAFPLARMLHEVLTRFILTGKPGLPPDPLGFLAYQGIVSAGFAIGFLWLHERMAPRWWQRLAAHDEDARRVYLRYASHAQAMYEAKERRKAATSRYRGASGKKATTPAR
ncbi:hypothetical protein [Actinophytocola sp.]|uniref:hypothetical protein n=1 Tax=Actinophytocola sp. TaxID=1872138 RepID=UPI002EDBA7E8